MKKLLRRTNATLLGLLGLLAAGPLAAQNLVPTPWEALPTLLSTDAMYGRSIQLPTATAAWALLSGGYGLQSYSDNLYASADNGLHWQSYTTKYSDNSNYTYGANIIDFSAADGQNAYTLERLPVQYAASTYQVRRLQATATGISATTVAPVPGTPWLIRFFKASTGVVGSTVSGVRSLYRTDDAGQTWTPVYTSPTLVAKSIQLLDTHLWVATNSQVLHSADAGQTWVASTPPLPLEQIAFRDAQHGLACGSGGQPLYSTTDGGTTWSLLAATGSRRLSGLRAVPGSAGTYFSFGNDIATLAGSAISYDDGQSWQTLESTSTLGTAVGGPNNRVWGMYANNHFYNITDPMVLRLASAVLATAPASATPSSSPYPNPTTGRVQLPAAGPYQQVQVYDATGRLCRSAALAPAETTLDLSPYGAGLYVLRLLGGTASPQTQRLTVQP